MPFWRAWLMLAVVAVPLAWHLHTMRQERDMFYKRAVMVEAFVAVEHKMTHQQLEDFNKRLDAVKLPKGVLLTDN